MLVIEAKKDVEPVVQITELILTSFRKDMIPAENSIIRFF